MSPIASVYSNGSSFTSSPSQSTFSISRDSSSASPPMINAETGIRLPSGGLNDIASMPMRDLAHMPHKANSSPAAYYQNYAPVDQHRRNTVHLPMGSPAEIHRRPLSSQGMPAAEWGDVATDEMTPTGGPPTTSPKSLSVS
jgi:hypothetical protein